MPVPVSFGAWLVAMHLPITQLLLAPVAPLAIGFGLCALLTQLCIDRFGGPGFHDRKERTAAFDSAAMPDQVLDVRAR